MKKGLKNKKLVYAGLGMALVAVVCTGGFTATKTKSQAGSNGTERDWSLHLPHENGNYYFPFQTKETNSEEGTITVEEMSGTTGVNVWFNTGGSLKNATRVSEIRRIGKKNIGKSRKVYYFKGNHKKGMKVDLGIENQEYTVIIQDEASGVVNYK